jgi:hypothetical protein
MLKATQREQPGWIDSSSLQNFPCEVLSKIDQLWINNSGGKFGFSVQKQIYLNCKANPFVKSGKTWDCFGDQVGWRVKGTQENWVAYQSVTFNSSAPKGHLPFLPKGKGFFGIDDNVPGEVGWAFLLQKLENCSL